MMKTILGAGVALALLAPAAMAQQAPPAPPSPQDSAKPAPPPGPQAGRDNDDDAPEADGPRGGRWRHHMPPPPPPKSARFRIEAGDVSLALTCPQDEPLKNCQDFALQLLDKAGSIAGPRR